MDFNELSDTYVNTENWHGEVFDALHKRVQEIPWLREHRDFVERHEWGMNDRSHSGMWELIIQTMPASFSAVEIGVYRGQVVSLWGLIARQSGKRPSIYGVSPFRGTDDAVNSYNKDLNYLENVETIFRQFQVPWEWFVPIKGMSQQPEIIAETSRYAPYDILYIDGGHEYESVQQDIENYTPMLRGGGILVMDDASCYLNMPEFSMKDGYARCWPGILPVSNAIRDFLETDKGFVHCFAVGHNRVFKKL